MKKNIIIYTRFSLVNCNLTKAWKSARLSSDQKAYIEKIMDPERLKARYDIFVNYSIPLLNMARERHPDLEINLLVHSSTTLPENMQNALRSLTVKHAWIKVDFFHPDEYYNNEESFRDLMSMKTGLNETEVIPIMRLDDDDLMSPFYFDLLKKYISQNFLGFTFHTPRGYEALYDGNSFVYFSSMDAPKTGIGLAYLAEWNSKEKKFTTQYILPPGSHGNTDMLAPVILDGSANVILRTKHFFNDARSTRDGYSFTTVESIESRYFKEKEDLSVVAENFPIFKSSNISKD